MRTRAYFSIAAGAAVFAGAWAALARGGPFMRTWFYCFAWWSFIAVLDGANRLRLRASPLAAPPGALWTALASIPLWLLFEAFNLRLANWSYHGVPADRAVRWLGCAIAFATVVPALKELAALVLSFLDDGPRRARLRVTGSLLRGLTAAGALAIVLTLAAPRLFFPLVWLGFIFLVEPANYLRGRPSMLRDLEEGRRAPLYAWMAGGLAAGIVWESLNWFAGSHWEYHIPYLDFGHIFQMPVFGFGGFVVFALEVFALDSLLRGVYLRMRPAVRALFWIAGLAFSIAVLALIDRFSVVF